MTVGDRVVKGIIKERGEARRIYTEAKAREKSSAPRSGTPQHFQPRPANIEPGQQVTITIRYSQRCQRERRPLRVRFSDRGRPPLHPRLAERPGGGGPDALVVPPATSAARPRRARRRSPIRIRSRPPTRCRMPIASPRRWPWRDSGPVTI